MRWRHLTPQDKYLGKAKLGSNSKRRQSKCIISDITLAHCLRYASEISGPDLSRLVVKKVIFTCIINIYKTDMSALFFINRQLFILRINWPPISMHASLCCLATTSLSWTILLGQKQWFDCHKSSHFMLLCLCKIVLTSSLAVQ